MLTQEQVLAYKASNDDVPFKKGMMVIIPKGTTIKTMHPSRDFFVTKHKMMVKIHHVLNWLPVYHKGKEPVICWSGSGGYWNEAAVSDLLQVNYDGKIIEKPDIKRDFPELFMRTE